MADPLHWTDEDIERLALYDDRDKDDALTWWYASVSGALALLLTRPGQEPRYTFDMASGSYLDAKTGKAVADDVVKDTLDGALDKAILEVSAMADQVAEGTLPLAQWQANMLKVLKNTHYASGSLAAGGTLLREALESVVQTTASLAEQLRYLQNFSDQVNMGLIRLDGAFNARARLYAQAARQHYESGKIEVKRVVLQHDEIMNVCPQDEASCEDCFNEAERGWVPIGEMSIPGTRRCNKNCRCRLVTRRADTA